VNDAPESKGFTLTGDKKLDFNQQVEVGVDEIALDVDKDNLTIELISSTSGVTSIVDNGKTFLFSSDKE